MAPLARTSLRLVLLDIRIDDARDVVLVFLDLFQQSVVVFLVVFLDILFEVLGLGRVVGDNRLAVLVLGILGFDRRFLDDFDRFLGLRLFILGLGRAFLSLLVLDLFGFLVLGDNDRRGLGRGLRHPRAALLQQRLGLEGEGAFGAFDR